MGIAPDLLGNHRTEKKRSRELLGANTSDPKHVLKEAKSLEWKLGVLKRRSAEGRREMFSAVSLCFLRGRLSFPQRRDRDPV
jgi:hypothetical protein